MSTVKGLFSPSLISKDVSDSLPEPYKIRPLERDDYAKGFLDCLKVLTHIGDVTEQQFQERYDWMDTQAKGGYYILVIEDGKKIVATGVLVVERKFIHNLGTIGHIEEISVREEEQGKHLGLTMIKALDSVAINVGCYKCILNCSEKNEAFYIKCGYHKASTEMAHYFEEEKSAYERG
ncbi:acyl-CoA N-acyltransferase [Xylogone sp. PMI_703]|nr:acyl-CoA N-acyltransferase [Xylogone sp. PMI_703]